jgi:NTP pyrophosphatase (non-canonical NTP hydrolase)
MKDTLTFFNIAKPNPTKRDFFTQYSVHLEEFTESVEAIGGGGGALHEELISATNSLRADAVNQPEDNIDAAYAVINRVGMLDSLADQYVTLIGTARALGMDIEGAVKEVEASNLSKFIYVGTGQLSDLEWIHMDEQKRQIESEGRYKGVYWERVGEYVVFYDENGKILKSPSTYFEPKLEQFI